MIALEMPLTSVMLNINGQPISLTEHHLSVREHYEEGVGFRSLYHYTAFFGTYVVHLYFDKQGMQSLPFIKEVSTESKTITEPLASQEIPVIQKLFLHYVNPKMHELNTLHANQIMALRQAFYPKIDKLFDADGFKEDISILDELIELGTILKKISYHQRENISSLTYLIKTKQILMQPERLSFEPTVCEESKSRKEPETTSFDEPSCATLLVSHKSMQDDLFTQAHNACETFETIYERAQSLNREYDSLRFLQFEEKAKVLEELNALLAQLFILNETLLDYERRKAITNKSLLHKASLGLECLNSAYEEKGCDLLTNCLSSPSQFQKIGDRLSYFARFISSDRIDAVIRRGNDAIFKYLLKYTHISIDQYQVKLKKEGPAYYMVSAAYHLGHLDCFVTLLQSGANMLVPDENDLPLAHIIFNLPLTNPFRRAFFEETPRINSLFATLAFAIREKLSDPSLLMIDVIHLHQSLNIYEAASLESFHVYKKTKNNMAKLQEQFNQDEYHALLQMPEFAEKFREHRELLAEFKKIARSRRIEHELMRDTSLLYKHLVGNFDKDGSLKGFIRSMNKSQLLESIDVSISQLSDQLYLLKNNNKYLPPKERKYFNEVHQRVLKNEQALYGSSLHNDMSPLIKLKESLNLVIKIMSELSKRHLPSSPQLKDTRAFYAAPKHQVERVSDEEIEEMCELAQNTEDLNELHIAESKWAAFRRAEDDYLEENLYTNVGDKVVSKDFADAAGIDIDTEEFKLVSRF